MSAVGKVEIVSTSFAEVSAESERLRTAARAMLAALEQMLDGMRLANIGEASHPTLRAGCHAARKARAQAEAAGIKAP